MKWTLDSLERACRKVLLSGSKLNLTELPPNHCAEVTYGKDVRIKVDSHKVGTRTAVIHELLHVVLDAELKAFDSAAEEVIIEALEAALDKRIANSRRRIVWWRTTISSLLKR